MYQLQVANNLPKIAIYNGTDWTYCNGYTALENTKWYQITGTLSNTQLKIYVNGVIENTCIFSGTIATNAAGVSIGKYGEIVSSFQVQ